MKTSQKTDDFSLRDSGDIDVTHTLSVDPQKDNLTSEELADFCEKEEPFYRTLYERTGFLEELECEVQDDEVSCSELTSAVEDT